MTQRILRIEEVKAKTGLGRSSIYKFIKDGSFPSPIRLGPRAVGFSSEDLDKWIEGRIAASHESANR